MKKLILFMALVMTFPSCEESVILDTEQVDPQLVIHMHLSSKNKYQEAAISLSVDFYDVEKPPVVEDAEVKVEDLTTGDVYHLYFNPEYQKYISESPFAGVPGHEYMLEVLYQGEIYTARESMPAVTEIDRISYSVDFNEKQNPSKEGYFYVANIFAHEPQETEDYYLFKFYRNDSVTYSNNTDIYFADDKLIGEQISGLPTPVYYSSGDVAKVEMYGITREAYVYLSDLSFVMNNDSGMFSPPPANPRTNLTNGAIGYFMVSDVAQAAIEIK